MKAVRFLLISLALIVLASSLVNQRPGLSRAQTDQTNGAPCCGQDETAPREIDFPYYSLREGFESTLLLVSDSPKPLEFVMAVRSVSGQTVVAPGMSIQPQEKLPIDLRSLLAQLGADPTGDFAEGSISVYFNGTIMPLAGQLTMSNPARRLIFESEVVDNSPGLGLLPKQLHALWWGIGAGRDARVMVSNTAGEAVSADLFLDFRGERHSAAPLTFRPHETKVLSITELLSVLDESPATAPEGGISIVARGPKPSLVAQGRITDVLTGFSTTLNFPDPSLQRASALHASGVPIGKPSAGSPYAGAGVFIPHVIVRNLTGVPQTVTVTTEYPGEDGPAQTPLPPFLLGPYGTEDFRLDDYFGLLPLPLPFCSIRIQYSGPPGSAMAEVTSIDQKGDLVIDSRLANEGDGWAGSGAHPWHLDDETESVLFLTNMGEKDARIGFQVQAGGIHYYLTGLRLSPHETRAIDLRKLRDKQQDDFQGNKIPAGAADGSVVWIRLDNFPVMGRLVVLQRHRGMVSNYDCTTAHCPAGYSALGVSPTNTDMCPNTTSPYTATATFTDSNGVNSYYGVTSDSTWSSDNLPTATVDNAPTYGLVHAQQTAGTANITGTHTDSTYKWNVVERMCDEIPVRRFNYGAANVPAPTITLSRQSLTSTSANGSRSSCAGNPAFTYSATGSGNIASYTTQNANANPNTASINAPSNPGGSPTPGGLGTLTATYHVSTGATASKSFPAATFGLSCYVTALESDWGDATNGTCGSISYRGINYSGSSTNPSGLPPRQYCNAFLATVMVNGSGVLKDTTTKIQYGSGSYPNWVFTVVTVINGADGSPVVAGQTLARDRSIIPGINNTHVQSPSGTYLANDIGSIITGYRLDMYQGAGNANCANYPNSIVVGVCDQVTSTCPGYTIQ